MLSYANVSRAITKIFLAQTFKSRGQKAVSPPQRECKGKSAGKGVTAPANEISYASIGSTNELIGLNYFFILFHLKLEKNFHKVQSVFVNKLLNGGFT